MLRIFVLLALFICWSWSLNRDECEAKRAFDSQSHQFDRGGIYNDLGDSRKLLLLLLSGRNMGYGNDNIIINGLSDNYGNDNILISGLSDNTGSADNIITDDNHMGGIDWYYYYYLQDGEVEIDSHDVGHSGTFTPGALALSTPNLWMPSTSLDIGKYDAMAFLSPRCLHTATLPYRPSRHCSVYSIPTRHESQCYAHYCHRYQFVPNNGEWSNRVLDSPSANDRFSGDSTAGINESISAAVPDDDPDKNSNLSPTWGEVEMIANALITATEMMTPPSYSGKEWRHIWLITTRTDIRLTPWYYEDFDYFIGSRKSGEHSYCSFNLSVDGDVPTVRRFDHSVDILIPIIATVHLYPISEQVAEDSDCELWTALMGEATSVSTVLNVHSSTTVGIKHMKMTVLLQGRCYGETGRLLLCHCHKCYSCLREFATSAPAPMDAQTPLLPTTYHVSTWVGYYDYSFVVTSFGPCYSTDTLPLHMHSCRCSNHDGGDFPWKVPLYSDGSNKQPRKYTERSSKQPRKYTERKHTGCHYKKSHKTSVIGLVLSDIDASYELEVARGYYYDQSLNNGIGRPYKLSRNRKEDSDLISSGYYWGASALIIKSPMYTMHNYHPMHLVRSQDNGEPIGCIFRWKTNGELADYIVKPRKYGERIVCAINPRYYLLHHGANFMADVATSTSMFASIDSITDTLSGVDDYLNGHVETIGAKVCVIGDFDVNIDNNITNGVGKSYANHAVDWGAVFEPLTSIYGHYCAAWKAQGKPPYLMFDTSVTSYADIRTSPSPPCAIIGRLLRLLLMRIKSFGMPLCEGNCRSTDSDAMYAWPTSENGEDDLVVEVEKQGLNDDTNMPSRTSLVNGEHLLHGMIKETDSNSTDRSSLLVIYLMQQLSMQLLMNLVQYCLSQEHPTSIEAERSYEGVILPGPRTRCVLTDDVFTGGLNIPTVDLHSCIPSKIKNLRSYLGLLSSECMPQHLNELCRNDPTSSGRTHDATIVNFSSDIQSKNATHTNHLMLSYSFTLENISSGTLRFNAIIKYWAYQAISIWLILQPVLFLKRVKLKLTSTTSNATTSNGHQTVGRLMGSSGLQYYINRTNHGTNRRGVTNECRPHVDTDSISTIDASTFREYWYSKSNHISRWCSQGI